jgi:cytidylate kinase
MFLVGRRHISGTCFGVRRQFEAAQFAQKDSKDQLANVISRGGWRASLIPEVIMFRVVTVEREYGSGGGLVAQRVAADLEWKLLDHTLISNVAQAAQVDAGTVERYDEHVDSWWHRVNREGLQAWSIAAGVALEDARIFDADTTAEFAQQCIAEAAAAGKCVIVGRGAECVLQGLQDALRVFIYAPWEARVSRVRTRVEEGQDLEDLIRETDRERASYIRTYYGREWKDPHLYHMMISSQVGIEGAASTIVNAVLRSRRLERQ